MKRSRRGPRPEGAAERGEDASSRPLEDFRLEAALQSTLLSIAPSTGLRVDVDAEKGIVYLRGEVASEEQKAEAEGIIKSVLPRGVRDLRNELVVNPWLPRLPHP